MTMRRFVVNARGEATEAPVTRNPRKPFDKAAWHKRKAAEALAAHQIETCYKHYTPRQIFHAEEMQGASVEAGVPVLSAKQEDIARMMRDNRAVGL